MNFRLFSKIQWITLLAAVVAVVIIFAFGNINYPKQAIAKSQQIANQVTAKSIEDQTLATANPELVAKVKTLQKQLELAKTVEEKIQANNALAYFYQNDLENEDLILYYSAEKHKLENSQKTLTFAANYILGETINYSGPQNIMAYRANLAKSLFEKAIANEPNNDSLKIGLAGCIMHGATTDDPMAGKNMVDKVLAKDSTNAFAHKMMGYGGLQTAQYDKAINRFVKAYEYNQKDTTLALRIAMIAKKFGNKPIADKFFTISKKLLVNDKTYLDMFSKEFESVK
jgi:hypothetical protein